MCVWCVWVCVWRLKILEVCQAAKDKGGARNIIILEVHRTDTLRRTLRARPALSPVALPLQARGEEGEAGAHGRLSAPRVTAFNLCRVRRGR